MARPPSQASPTPARERIQAIDVLRGFAIFGILIVNMEGYDWPILYMRAIDSGNWPGTVDKLAALLIEVAATDNFINLLGFLFGLSFALQLLRARASGAPFVRLQLRRCAVLFLIGLGHGLLVWWGDILIFFSMLGLLLLLFRNCGERALLGWAAALYAATFVWPEWQAVRLLLGPGTAAPSLAVDAAAMVRRSIAIYGHGSFAEIARQRAADLASWIPYLPGRIVHRMAPFILGLWLGRRGNVAATLADPAFIRRLLRWGLSVGIGGELLLQLVYLEAAPAAARLLAIPLTAVCKPALTCGYAGMVLYLFQQTRARSWLAPVASLGRMSLSNYLCQSVICSLIFYSYGLGLYGRVGPAAGLGLAVVIYLVQLPASVAWGRRFRFGPVEWLWRSLTYGRRQPLRWA